MTPKISEKDWLKDFNEFMNVDGERVPEELSQKILAHVHRDLNPSPWLVFFKLLGIHAVVGTSSLAVCNQFGMSPFKSDFSLSDYFMKFGHSFCMTLCGVLFISLSVAMAATIFRPEEFRILRKNSALQIFALSTFSLGIFLALGAEISLSIGVLWFLGAMAGGMLSAFTLRNPKISVV